MEKKKSKFDIPSFQSNIPLVRKALIDTLCQRPDYSSCYLDLTHAYIKGPFIFENKFKLNKFVKILNLITLLLETHFLSGLISLLNLGIASLSDLFLCLILKESETRNLSLPSLSSLSSLSFPHSLIPSSLSFPHYLIPSTRPRSFIHVQNQCPITFHVVAITFSHQ